MCYNYVNLNMEVHNMPKLDKQHRVTIPFDLREELGWKFPQTLALCYDFSTPDAIIINKRETCKSHCVLCFREVDSKGRISFPKEALALLKADWDDFFIIYIKNGEFFIRKP